MNKLFIAIATGLGAGYVPKTPGTIGSLWGLALFWPLRHADKPIQWAVAIALLALSIYVAEKAEKIFAQKDCQKIVIDEVIGQYLACLFITPTLPAMLLTFGLFRICDIIKVFPANWAQKKLPGGLGIVMDDVFAGLQAGILFYILFNWRT